MIRAYRSLRTLVAALALFTLGALAAASPARAQLPDPRVELGVSYYQPSFDSSVRLDSSTLGSGTELDLEDDLGVEDDASELRGELSIRLGGPFRLVIDHVEFERSGSSTLGRTVQFGDVVYAADAVLVSSVESSHTGAAVRYSFVKNPTADVAVSLGVSQLDVAARLSGRAIATANGVPIGSVEVLEEGEASGPVPLVGLHAALWLAQRMRLRLDARYIDVGELVDEDKWSGSMTEYAATLDYLLLPWLSVSGGWAATSISADFDDGDEIGSVDYDFDGFRAGLTFTF